MANRDNLNKLNVSILKSIATEHGVDIDKKKKSDLIADILTCQAPVSALTPVVYRASEIEAITPVFSCNFQENLPPFNKVTYLKDAFTSPEISFSQIYDFMVSRKRESGEAVNNFKGLDRAVKHFSAGDVSIIGIAKVTESILYIKGTCQASMKKHQYDVYVCISNTVPTLDAVIDYGYCQCPVGLAQTCSHIGSLLFALSNAKVADTCSSTSRLCEWNVPRQTVQPRPMRTLTTGKPALVPNTEMVTSKTDSMYMSTFDPRHTSDRNHDVSRTLQQLRDLKDIFPNTGLSHLWNIPDRVQDACNEIEVTTVPDPMFQQMENMLFTNASKENLPRLDISEVLVHYIETYTRGQRSSEMWKDLHIGRLTSSVFGEVLRAGDNPKSLVKRIVEGSNLDSYNALPPAVQWGIDSESKAKEEYAVLQSMSNPNSPFKVEETGLTLYGSYSFLGASSDGKITDGEMSGLLEIKCPYSIKGNKVNKMEVLDIMALNHQEFCLECLDGDVRLNRKHKFYAQVQGEMAIMSLPWCDFVVWTGAQKNNIFVERIHFDAEFISMMMPKLVEFYMRHIFPVFYQ